MAADPRSASLLTQSQTPSVVESFGYGTSLRRPSNPKLGFLYYDTTLNLEMVFTTSGWRTVGVQSIAMAGFGTTAQRPANPQPGFLFFDTTLQQQLTWAGANWIVIGPISSTGAMVGFGTTAQRPATPANGFLYYDTTLQQEVVWSGTAWVPIGPSTSGAAPVVTSPGTAAAVNGSPFSYQITATNSPTGYGEIGSLPTGLSINNTTGLISGTPTSVGSFGITVQATNGTGTGTKPLTITVSVASTAPTITSPSTASANQGTAFSYQITATNSPTSYGVGGALPVGLSLNASTGLISGTPAQSGSFPLTVSATNGTGTGLGPLALTVAAGAVPGALFRSIAGVAICSPSTAVIIGGILNSATASTLSISIKVATGGQFAPGVNWQLVTPDGVVAQSGTTAGGESNIGFFINTSQQGGYTLVVSTASATFIPELDMVVTGVAQFINGSIRATVVGTPLAPPDGFDILLTISQLDPSTQLGFAHFTEGTTNVLRQPPNYGWNFNGDTVNNPKSDWTSGLTQITLIGSASGATSSDSRLEVGP